MITSFSVATHGLRKHVFLFLRVCVVDEFGVIIIVSSWLHIWLINKSSKVLGNVYMSILGQKLLSWLQRMSDRMFLANSLSSRITIGFREQVLTDQPLNVSCVMWHLLVSNHVVGSTGPVSGKSTLISKHLFVLVN